MEVGGRIKFLNGFHLSGYIYLNWRRLEDGVVGGGGRVAAAVAIFAPWFRIWLVGKPHFLQLTFIPDNSSGSVDAFPISARCYVMIVLLGIFHISPLLST